MGEIMTYDVIIVGAGSAGCPLAARLSENGTRKVLLIEAGPHYRRVEDYPEELLQATSAVSSTPGHPNNWSFIGQVSSKVAYPVPRGKVVGGSSALNATVFCRGTPEDFDGWAAAGNDAWSYEKVLPYFRKIEADRDFTNQYHGNLGPIPVRRVPREDLAPDQQAFLTACLDMGYPEDPDKNSPDSDGVGILPMNNVDGLRVNVAMAYLEPVRNRANLTIESNMFVRRVVFDGQKAVGVEVEQAGETRLISGSEVILSAGAIKSPHLLMLSGIGPAAELRANGIEIIHDSAGVGKNLMDHPTVVVPYSLTKKWADKPNLQQVQVSLQYTATGSPIRHDVEINPCCINPFGSSASGMGSFGGGIAAFLKRPLATLAGLRGVSIKRLVTQLLQRDDLLVICSLQQPEGRGSLTLKSSDPHQQPELRYNYFENSFDRQRMREAVRLTSKLLDHKALKSLGASMKAPTRPVLENDDALDEWLLGNVFTAVHTAGTCKMGLASDESAVVDQYGRVHGVSGLRVVDCSIQPTSVRRPANATAIMIGEYAADLIGAADPSL